MPRNDDIQTGERYARSPMTGCYYRVTKWVDKGDGKLVCHEKEEVEREDVPDRWLEALDGGEN
jgi:hypothetical protein